MSDLLVIIGGSTLTNFALSPAPSVEGGPFHSQGKRGVVAGTQRRMRLDGNPEAFQRGPRASLTQGMFHSSLVWGVAGGASPPSIGANDGGNPSAPWPIGDGEGDRAASQEDGQRGSA